MIATSFGPRRRILANPYFNSTPFRPRLAITDESNNRMLLTAEIKQEMTRRWMEKLYVRPISAPETLIAETSIETEHVSINELSFQTHNSRRTKTEQRKSE